MGGNRRADKMAETKRRNLQRLFGGVVVVFDGAGEHQEVQYSPFDPEYPNKKAKKKVETKPGNFRTKDLRQFFEEWGRGWDRKTRTQVPGVNRSELQWGLQTIGLH